MAKHADAAMRAICVGKRENTDAVTVLVEFLGRLAAGTTRAATRRCKNVWRRNTYGDHVRLASHDCSASDEGGGTGNGWRGGAGSRGALSSGGLLCGCSFHSPSDSGGVDFVWCA